MQIGHVAVAGVIASYAPEISAAVGGPHVEALSFESIAVVYLAHFLPNLDVVPIYLGWASDRFHCTYSHTFMFATAVVLALWPINVSWAALAAVSLLLHYLADSPSSVGLPLLLPFNGRKFTLSLWADTGHSGWASFKGTYQQSWTWITEGGMFVVMAIRFYQVQMWPFSV